ncbi:MAG: alkaline phosphatase [Magnetococcales bacterium]|nr:alkaline phosphatase [Magnetococcales bacterium]
MSHTKKRVISLYPGIRNFQIITIIVILTFTGFIGLFLAKTPEAYAKNIILFIGDGMGPEQVRAAGYYRHNHPNSLSFERFSFRTTIATDAADNPVTDSAAGATAMATGQRVNVGVLSQAIPGNGRDYETILEHMAKQGKMTGLITTVPISHATPAAFASHQPSRKNSAGIIQNYFENSRPDLLMGVKGEEIPVQTIEKAGYTYITSIDTLPEPDPNNGPILARFEEVPKLKDLTQFALSYLQHDTNGFFLMIEAGRIDWAAHNHDTKKMIDAILDLSDAAAYAKKWAKKHEKTLILVTADHETGGLKIDRPKGIGTLPHVTWRTHGHTNTPVGLYAWGRQAGLIRSANHLTDIYDIIRESTDPIPR